MKIIPRAIFHRYLLIHRDKALSPWKIYFEHIKTDAMLHKYLFNEMHS